MRRRLGLALGAFAVLGAGVVGARAIASRNARLPNPPREMSVGVAAPSVSLRDDQGRPFTLASLKGAPTLLVFFQTCSCPLCRAQLANLQRYESGFREAGIHLLAMSPDSAAQLTRLRSELRLGFALATDENETAVSAFCAGQTHCEVLLDRDGVVRWGGWSESWSDAPDPDLILKEAVQLAGG